MLVNLVTPFTDEDRGQETLQTCLAQSSPPSPLPLSPLRAPHPITVTVSSPRISGWSLGVLLDFFLPHRSWRSILHTPQLYPHLSFHSYFLFTPLPRPTFLKVGSQEHWSPEREGVPQSINFGKYCMPYALLKESQ